MPQLKNKDLREHFESLLKLSTYLWLNLFLLASGLALAVKTHGWIQSVGASIVAAAVVGFLFVYQMKIDRQFDQSRTLYDKWGLLTIENNRSDKDMYGELVASCTGNLDVIAVSLSRFSNDFRQELAELDKRGVKMRFLLLDPDSSKVAERALEDRNPETPDAASLQARIRSAALSFHNLNLKNLEVRYYFCTPSINYFRIDNRAFVGSYFVGTSSRNSVTFFCRNGDDLAMWYSNHFDAVWSSNEFSRPA